MEEALIGGAVAHRGNDALRDLFGVVSLQALLAFAGGGQHVAGGVHVFDAIFGLDVGGGRQGVDPVGDLDGADAGLVEASVVLGEEFEPLDLVGALGVEGVDAVGELDLGIEQGVGLVCGCLGVLGGDGGLHLGDGDVLADGGQGGAGLLDGGGDLVGRDAVAVLRGREGEGFFVGRNDDLRVLHLRGQGRVDGRRELLDGVVGDGGHGLHGALGEEGTDEGRQGGRPLHGLVGGSLGVDRDTGLVERGRGGLAFDGEGHVRCVGARGDGSDDLVTGHAVDGGPGDGGARQHAAGVVRRVDNDGADDNEDEGARRADRPPGFSGKFLEHRRHPITSSRLTKVDG